ncbi:HU family DNA-binding protein [Caedibacter taeniospiralis]|uniref:Putative integration host factor alpha subunit n=1 Tax=Caedibacter taeniospiralis TaxID=28907 RepID=Q6TFE9_CAETA|nr:HU family DNA-binding protein [Caedibacter taeniospiralis]AAR87110.1 putative integration host factor alpha subunit [Caedibacter taeniospiralis]
MINAEKKLNQENDKQEVLKRGRGRPCKKDNRSMSRNELIKHLSLKTKFSREDCNHFFYELMNLLREQLLNNRIILLEGLGRFETRVSFRKNAHNPRTMEKIKPREKRVVLFKFANEFKALISDEAHIPNPDNLLDYVDNLDKKPRGRPKKIVQKSSIEDKPKRPRGRPKIFFKDTKNKDELES